MSDYYIKDAPKNGKYDLQNIFKFIYDKTRPPMFTDIEKIDYHEITIIAESLVDDINFMAVYNLKEKLKYEILWLTIGLCVYGSIIEKTENLVYMCFRNLIYVLWRIRKWIKINYHMVHSLHQVRLI